MDDTSVILFDGVCNLCDGTVRFIARKDPEGIFKFAPLQSKTAQSYLNRFNLRTDDFDTIVLVSRGRVYTKSSAFLETARKLRGLWPLLYGFKIVPPFVRDWIYGLIARNRYRWFGKKDACMIPDAGLKARFLE